MRIAMPMYASIPWGREIALKLAELGHEIHVIDFSVPCNESDIYWPIEDWKSINAKAQGRIQQHYFKYSVNHRLRYVVFASALRKLFHRNQIQIVFVLGVGGFAAMTYLSGFRPYVVYTTGSDILLVKGLNKRINRRILRSAAGIISNGLYLAEKTVALCGGKDVLPLYIGLDTEHFSPRIEETDSSVQIIASRGFFPVYNNEYLIRALALLPEESSLRRVIFPSAGPDLGHVKSLANEILPSHMKKRICFCGGVSDKEMLQHLQESSIYVSLSRSDGTSVSTLEALSCGLFPLLSDIPQNREWVDPDKENGILVPLDQPDVLASALQRAITGESMRKKARSINRSLILERADGKRNMILLSKKLETIFESRH